LNIKIKIQYKNERQEIYCNRGGKYLNLSTKEIIDIPNFVFAMNFIPLRKNKP